MLTKKQITKIVKRRYECSTAVAKDTTDRILAKKHVFFLESEVDTFCKILEDMNEC